MSVIQSVNVNNDGSFLNIGTTEEYEYFHIREDAYTKSTYYPEIVNGQPQWIQYSTVYSVFINVTPGTIISIKATDDYNANLVFTSNNDFTEECLYISQTKIVKGTSQSIVVPTGANYAFFMDYKEGSISDMISIPLLGKHIIYKTEFYELPYRLEIYPDENTNQWYYVNSETWGHIYCRFIQVSEGDVIYVKTDEQYKGIGGFLKTLGSQYGDSIDRCEEQGYIFFEQNTLIKLNAPSGAKYLYFNDSISERLSTKADENGCVEPIIYVKHKQETHIIRASQNPASTSSFVREELQIIVPYQGQKFVDNVLCLMNCSNDGSIYGNAAISFMDPNFKERCAIGYSRNQVIQPGGYVPNTLYLEFGNAFETNENTNTDFRLICTLQNRGYFFPIEALCNGELNFNVRYGKNVNVTGGAIVANGGIVLKSPNGTSYNLNVDNNGNLSTSTLLSKNIVLLGDSITWMGGDNCDQDNSWTKYFKEAINPKSIKSYARGGATWTNTENTTYDISENTSDNSDDNVIYNQINRLIDAYDNETQVKPDVIIIAAGVNDAMLFEYNGSDTGHRRPNVYNESAADVFDSNTSNYITSSNINTITSLARTIRYNCELIIQKFPDVRIFLLTPLQSLTATNQHLTEVSNIIFDCASRLSIPCIRQEQECGIWRIRENISYLFTSDGVHLNSRGGSRVGYYLANRIKSLIEY